MHAVKYKASSIQVSGVEQNRSYLAKFNEECAHFKISRGIIETNFTTAEVSR